MTAIESNAFPPLSWAVAPAFDASGWADDTFPFLLLKDVLRNISHFFLPKPMIVKLGAREEVPFNFVLSLDIDNCTSQYSFGIFGSRIDTQCPLQVYRSSGFVDVTV